MPEQCILRVDGSREALPEGLSSKALSELIRAELFDTVRLRQFPGSWVMLVDDRGHDRALPVNIEATRLYHANCRPGTTHMIVGDVVIVRDAYFCEPIEA